MRPAASKTQCAVPDKHHVLQGAAEHGATSLTSSRWVYGGVDDQKEWRHMLQSNRNKVMHKWNSLSCPATIAVRVQRIPRLRRPPNPRHTSCTKFTHIQPSDIPACTPHDTPSKCCNSQRASPTPARLTGPVPPLRQRVPSAETRATPAQCQPDRHCPYALHPNL